MGNLLLIEDDKSLGQTLKERLEKEGYKVYWAMTLAQARTNLNQNRIHLIILDVGLPDGSGFELARELKGKWPFIFVTAQTSAEDRLRGYELGGFEFIPKPFHLKEMLMRIEHVLDNHSLDSYQLSDGTQIEFSSLRIMNKEGSYQELSFKEVQLLKLLIEKSPMAVSRDMILDKIWGEGKFPTQRTIDNVIVRLRQVLGPWGGSLIHSVRGVGYQWLDKAESPNG